VVQKIEGIAEALILLWVIYINRERNRLTLPFHMAAKFLRVGVNTRNEFIGRKRPIWDKARSHS
jgi:hypothetical protein